MKKILGRYHFKFVLYIATIMYITILYSFPKHWYTNFWDKAYISEIRTFFVIGVKNLLAIIFTILFIYTLYLTY